VNGLKDRGPLVWHSPRKIPLGRKGLWDGSEITVPILSVGHAPFRGMKKRTRGAHGFVFRKLKRFSWWEKLRAIYDMSLLVRAPFFIYMDNEDARLLWMPTDEDMEAIMGDKCLIFQREEVACGMTAPVEIELASLGCPNGLNCGAFLARTEFFNDLREDLVELIEEGPGGMAYPEDTEYPRDPDPEAGNPGFLDRSAFQYLATIYPGDIAIDVGENYIVRSWP